MNYPPTIGDLLKRLGPTHQAAAERAGPLRPHATTVICRRFGISRPIAPRVFEGRGPRCTLIVFIDDATGRLTALRFAPVETTRAYLGALKDHVLAHGCPAAFYSDRHGIFRVNAKDAASGDGKTELGRVSERLRIELINALTPQAKGRVERANQTLQDRLVREMRLRGISSIEEAQAFTPAFIAAWNEKFAVPPRDSQDAHRP